jgi:DNA-binding protein H-NS
MKNSDLEKMPLDALWELHQRIIEVLSRRLKDETRKLQKQLDELGRKSGGYPIATSSIPKVQPKFRNPNNPSETWSGRGKMPRWLVKLIASGRNRDEFRVR